MTVKMATFTTHTRFLKQLLPKATALECRKYDMRYQIDLQNTI